MSCQLLKITAFLASFLVAQHLCAQKYEVVNSTVKFYSEAPLEDITAINENASGLLEVSSGEIAFLVPIRDFQFEKSLMKEHFNEKYMETEKHPRSVFSGRIQGWNRDNPGEQRVTADGKLTIHGITNNVNVSGTIRKRGDRILIHAEFVVLLEDYDIDRPQIMWQNIAEEIEVTVEFEMQPR